MPAVLREERLYECACAHQFIWYSRGQVERGLEERTHLDDEERVLFDRLEESAQDIVDERNEVFVGLFSGKRFLFVKDGFEEFQSRDLGHAVNTGKIKVQLPAYFEK